MADLLKSKTPKQVYDKLINEHDELSGPTDLKYMTWKGDRARKKDNKQDWQAADKTLQIISLRLKIGYPWTNHSFDL